VARSPSPRTRPEKSHAAPATGSGITSADIVDAALHIVEREGAAALTMRRLADELGAAETAIY